MTPPAAAAAPAVRPRRPSRPSAPRRVSGPARPTGVPRQAQAGTIAHTGQTGLVVGLLSGLESLAQHRLLDRLIRGRVWIGLVAFALIGIVTLQLGLLKLNGGIGRALEHEALLQRENATLSIENSELAAGTRVESHAAHLGMSLAPVGALHFLSADDRGDVDKAAAALAGAAHAAVQAREARAAESRASTEAEASSEAAGTESSGEGAAAAATSESEAGPESSAATSESSSGESSSSESSTSEPESSSAASSEAEPSGGIAATSTGE
jgi:hypothetical protein